MSMMWPPQSVKIVSIPSPLSAFATRWPPEIVSAGISDGTRSGGAESSFASGTVCATWASSYDVGLDVVVVLCYVRREVEGVVAHEALRQLGIACFECFDDVDVIDDR